MDPSPTSRSWMQPIVEYLQNGIIPKDEKSIMPFRMTILHFVIIQDKLYRKSRIGPYLRCLEDHKVVEVVKAIHEGVCGNHTGRKILILHGVEDRILLANNYKMDAFLHVKIYDAFQ